MALTLVIGNKRYSSWSLRPWLCMKACEIPFKEVRILIHKPDSFKRILKFSPAGRVPCLLDGKRHVWDSLSIMEYLAETFPKKHLWPKDKDARATARSICAEMHSSFQDLRQRMNMNCVSYFPGKGLTPEVQKDIDRILKIWMDCRKKYGKKGPFLFGSFTIADAFYAPVVFRFRTYGVKVDALSRRYMHTMLHLEPMQEWFREALLEKETIKAYEQYR